LVRGVVSVACWEFVEKFEFEGFRIPGIEGILSLTALLYSLPSDSGGSVVHLVPTCVVDMGVGAGKGLENNRLEDLGVPLGVRT